MQWGDLGSDLSRDFIYKINAAKNQNIMATPERFELP